MRGGEVMKDLFTVMVVLLLGVFAVTGVVSAQTATPSTSITPSTTITPTNTPTPSGSVQGSSVTVPNAAPATGRAN